MSVSFDNTDAISFKEDPALRGQDMWWGGVAVGSKVVGMPYDAGKIVIYDAETDAISFKEDSALRGKYMWRGGAAVGSKVVGVPSNSGKILIYVNADVYAASNPIIYPMIPIRRWLWRSVSQDQVHGSWGK